MLRIPIPNWSDEEVRKALRIVSETNPSWANLKTEIIEEYNKRDLSNKKECKCLSL